MNSDLTQSQEQRVWLESDLENNKDKRIFIFLHLPPFIYHESEPSLGHYDNIAEPDRSWLLNLIIKYNIELIFAGHTHFSFYNRIKKTDWVLLELHQESRTLENIFMELTKES